MCGENRKPGGNNNQVTMSFFGLLAVFFFFGMLQFFGASLQPHGCTPGLLGVSRHHERWDRGSHQGEGKLMGIL